MIFGVWLKVLPIGLSVPIGLEASGVTFLDRAAPCDSACINAVYYRYF